MWAYIDTSAMVKRYVREPGRAKVQTLAARHRLVSSVILPVELYSAFVRRTREGTLATVALPRLFTRVGADRPRWTLVATTNAVLDEAQLLVENHPLRTLDALHVASARVFEQHLRAPIVFISADKRQLAAAAREGMRVEAV
jgi:predicted nucleic acid-binding protein